MYTVLVVLLMILTLARTVAVARPGPVPEVTEGVLVGAVALMCGEVVACFAVMTHTESPVAGTILTLSILWALTLLAFTGTRLGAPKSVRTSTDVAFRMLASALQIGGLAFVLETLH